MPIQNAVVKTGATSASITGGTDMTFTPDGVQVTNGVHVANAAQTDFRVRENMTFVNRPPSLQSDGTYSKGKQTVYIKKPKILASGQIRINMIRLERELDPESTTAEELELRMLAVQVLGDSDFASYWTGGSLA